MYRRYIIVGIVFFLLVGAYFLFFNKSDGDKEYFKYYDKLKNSEEYEDSLKGVDLTIFESVEDEKYSYSITFDNVSIVNRDVKILVIKDGSDGKEYYPSFGIVDNKGYSIIPASNEKGEKEVKGVNLGIIDGSKIDYMLIYFSSNNHEQFVRVKVSNYLG